MKNKDLGMSAIWDLAGVSDGIMSALAQKDECKINGG